MTRRPNPHRNNAAEWLLWTALQPVGWALRLARWRRGRRAVKRRAARSAAGV